MVKRTRFEVWAQLRLAEQDEEAIRAFLHRTWSISNRRLVRRMHITVYHARRPMSEIRPVDERADVTLQAADTRFMVLAPGGENPRPELNPALKKVGVRVRRSSLSMAALLPFRQRLLPHETSAVLGSRLPSDHRRNAFGARHFQPHMSLLRAGNGLGRDLRILGDSFRSAFQTFTFDRFIIEMKRVDEDIYPPPCLAPGERC